MGGGGEGEEKSQSLRGKNGRGGEEEGRGGVKKVN